MIRASGAVLSAHSNAEPTTALAPVACERAAATRQVLSSALAGTVTVEAARFDAAAANILAMDVPGYWSCKRSKWTMRWAGSPWSATVHVEASLEQRAGVAPTATPSTPPTCRHTTAAGPTAGASKGGAAGGTTAAAAVAIGLFHRAKTGESVYAVVPQRDGIIQLVAEYAVAEAAKFGIEIPDSEAEVELDEGAGSAGSENRDRNNNSNNNRDSNRNRNNNSSAVKRKACADRT